MIAALWFAIGVVVAIGLVTLLVTVYSAGVKEGTRKAAEAIRKDDFEVK